MTALQEFDKKFGQLVQFQFRYLSMASATNVTNADLQNATATGSVVVMPGDGSIVGLGALVSGSASGATITAGSYVFRAHKDSTEIATTGYPSVEVNVSSGSSALGYSNYDTCPNKGIRFSAGDRLGISCTSTGSPTMDSGSPSLSANLYVVFD